MHANELVLLAAEISDRFSDLPLSLDWQGFDLEAYWTAARRRLDYWEKRLKVVRKGFARGSSEDLIAAERPTFDEVIIGDIFARVWTAAYVISDHNRTSAASISAVRSVWMGQQEAHGAVMKLIRMGIDRDLPSAHAVNRLRRKTERWNDVILAHLGNDARLFSFAVDRDRLKDFRGGQSVDDTTAVDSWPLFLASISKAFPIEEAHVANPLLNSEIFRAVSPVLPAGRSPMRTSEWVRPLFADRVWQRLEETSRQMDDWLESYLF